LGVNVKTSFSLRGIEEVSAEQNQGQNPAQFFSEKIRNAEQFSRGVARAIVGVWRRR
jgi:hypothetical protein